MGPARGLQEDHGRSGRCCVTATRPQPQAHAARPSRQRSATSRTLPASLSPRLKRPLRQDGRSSTSAGASGSSDHPTARVRHSRNGYRVSDQAPREGIPKGRGRYSKIASAEWEQTRRQQAGEGMPALVARTSQNSSDSTETALTGSSKARRISGSSGLRV